MEKIANEVDKITAIGYGVHRSFLDDLSEIDFEREAPKENEVLIDILYCGVCHSDLHQVKNDWANTVYPCIPGHEIIGKVIRKGSKVSKFEIGDVVGVGCMIDSCGSCDSCKDGIEQYCHGPKGWTATYNGPMKPDGSNTFCGYSNNLVVKESFVLKIPEALDIKSAAPILCAGVTTYSPLKHWNVKQGDHVAIAGLGGLGHMAVKIAKALGATVTVITTTEDKREDALRLGADNVITSENESELEKHELTFDLILVTIPEAFDVNPFIKTLKRDGSLVTVGLLGPYKKPTNNMEVAFQRRNISGSLIGSIQETQEVLDFCAAHQIAPEVEMIHIEDINKAFKKMEKEDVRYRFVIDMQSLKDKIKQEDE